MKAELQRAKEENLQIKEESRRYRGKMKKELHTIKGMLYDTKRRLVRGFPLRQQVQNLYRRKTSLQADNMALKEELQQGRIEVSRSNLRLLEKVDA